MGRFGGLRRLRSRRLARSLRRQLPALQPRGAHRLCRRRGPARLLPAERLPPRSRAGCIATRGAGRSSTSRLRRDWRGSSDRRSASRPPTSTATAGSTSSSPTTRQENQLWINQRDGTFLEHRARRGRGAWRLGRAQGEHGRRCRRLRCRRRRGSVHHRADRPGQHALRERRHGRCSRSRARAPASARPACRTPASGRRGSTSTTTAGWICSPSTATSTRTTPRWRGAGHPFPLGQRNQLLRNVGGRFEDVTARAGRAFELVEASRGAAFGDVDNDGDTDVLVANGAGRARLLVNEIGQRQALDRAAARRPGRPARHARRARRRRSIRTARCYGGALVPTAATRRPTIRACSSVWATRRSRRASESYGQPVRPKSGLRSQSTATRLCSRGRTVKLDQWSEAAGAEASIVLAACVVVLSACDAPASKHGSAPGGRPARPLATTSGSSPADSRSVQLLLRNHRKHEHIAGPTGGRVRRHGTGVPCSEAGRRGGSLFSPRAGARARGSGAGRTCSGMCIS